MKKQIRKKRYTFKNRAKRGGSKDIPIFIIAWNQYTYVKSIVEQLQKLNCKKIYIIDNKSTYEPLIKYLKDIDDKNGVKVLYQDNNYGHRVYENQNILDIAGDLYVVTDPDLTLNPKMPSNFLKIMSDVSEKYKANKVGFALDITNNLDLSKSLDGKKGETFHTNEKQYWNNRVNDSEYEMYRAPIDTTFALINKKYRVLGSLENSIRMAGNFTAVHRPWLINSEKELLPGEMDFYLNNDNKSTTINRWKKL